MIVTKELKSASVFVRQREYLVQSLLNSKSTNPGHSEDSFALQ